MDVLIACTGSRRIKAMFLHLPARSRAPHFCTLAAPSPRNVWTFANTFFTLIVSTSPSLQNSFSMIDSTLSRIRSL